MMKALELECIYSEVVNFAMQQNYVPIIRRVELKNLHPEDLQDLKVTISTEPEFAYPWEAQIALVPGDQAFELDKVNLKLSPAFLYGLTERIAGTLTIQVRKDQELLATRTENIMILAHDEWSGTLILPEIVAAFVTPNHPKVTEILVKAQRVLEQWTGTAAFTAYQSNNPQTVKMQMAAIYTALQKEGIAYSLPPASFELIGQRIRLCDTVLNQKTGTCLDLSLLYAGCLEASGLNPLLIFLKGHAFVGCWLEDTSFAEAVQDDVSLLTKRIAEGIHEICLVECTCWVAERPISFDEAIKAGEGHLKDTAQFELLVDIKRSRGSGIRPIPQRKAGDVAALSDGEFTSAGPETADGAIPSAPAPLEVFEKILSVDQVEVTRRQIWERKLLDLSLRNTLINFRVTKSTVQLMASRLDKLEDALAGGQEFQILGKPQDWENSLRDSKIYAIDHQISALEHLTQTEFAHKRLRTFLDGDELLLRVTHLYRQAKVSLEENGSNTLFLALGFLKWYETDLSERERYAPLVLIPIDIVRKVSQKGYVIRLRDEEPQMNITLLEMLRQDFGLSIGGLDPLPGDESGVDLKRVFNVMRQAVMQKSRWDVEEFAFIGLFSFSQFIMWNDLRHRGEDLKQNKMVASLMSGKLEWEPAAAFPDAAALDNELAPADLAVPISADSSQLAAVCAAGADNSFVLHGPPGTGKSQTITNIIANALFQGKTVLFIAEKMAALSVVQKRLAAIGLGPFSLELHSNKAKKKDVLSQLQQVLELGKVKAPEEYREKAERLHELRRQLNQVVEAIHRKRPWGFSLYEAIARWEQYQETSAAIKFNREQIGKLTAPIYTQWADLLSQLKTAGLAGGGIYGNPLREFANSDFSQSLKDEVGKELQEYRQAIRSLQQFLSQWSSFFDILPPRTYDQVAAVAELLKILGDFSYLPEGLLEDKDLALRQETVTQVCVWGKKRDELEKQLLSGFTPAILTFDYQQARQQWQRAETGWFLSKLLGQNKVSKSLKMLALNPAQLKKDQVITYLDLVEEYQGYAQKVSVNAELFSSLFNFLWQQGKPDWEQLATAYDRMLKLNEWAMKISTTATEFQNFRAALSREVKGDLTFFRQKYGDLLEATLKQFETMLALEDALSCKGGVDFIKLKNDSPHQDSFARSWLEHMDAKAGIWERNLDQLRSWCAFLLIKAQAEAAGLGNVLEALEQGTVREDELLPAAYQGIFQACAVYVIDEEPCLTAFNGELFTDKIAKYRETYAEFEQLTRQELAARLASRIPAASAGYANSSEIGILQRAIRSGGRMLSIRKLFDQIPTLLRRISPCLLMSPISVAQYLDPSYPPFDLIIFDEASQLPTCEAVGAIARGKNLIVVGDPKQLPPTNFFNANRFDEDNFEKEDLESVLDDCLALSMPQTHLLWHYRSRHESLILFSNRQYYDNRLYTFPSTNDLVSQVEFVPVDGFYDRGGTKQNKGEAEAVVAEILRRLQDPVLSRQSIGVVTFSSVQQNLIDDLLVEAFAAQPQLEELNNRTAEPVFIKNLENVQGDERDVILFSVGYGPDANGKVALNFGPINRDGGWRRLNVAVSRARQKMMVFSTLRPEQIDLSRTRSEGVAGLKAFLAFAQNGKAALPLKISEPERQEVGVVEKQIAARIRTLGYEAHTRIGSSEYKVDIGIVHPERPEEYILAVLCDGENYWDSKTAQERNILQGNVLTSLGWAIHRLWILDWWENPAGELAKIKAVVEEALTCGKRKDESPGQGEERRGQNGENDDHGGAVHNRASGDQENVFKPEVIKSIPGAIYAHGFQTVSEGTAADSGSQGTGAGIRAERDQDEHEGRRYLVCALAGGKGGADEFCLPQNNKLILAQMEGILAVEAPISRSLLSRRLLAAWGIARLGSRMERRLDELLKMGRIKANRSHQAVFYWQNQQKPEDYQSFRIPGQDGIRRDMEDIPAEEVANAIRYVLNHQISLAEEDLIKEVYKLFGFARGSAAIEKIIRSGVEAAVKRGYVTVADGGRVAVKE